jgi:hypothetical protein
MWFKKAGAEKTKRWKTKKIQQGGKANTDRLAAIEGVFIFCGFPMRWG